MPPAGQLDQFLSEGRLKDAAKLLDEATSLPRNLQIVRLRLEAQIGDPLLAKARAAELLETHLSKRERAACLDVFGRVTTIHGDVSNGIRCLRMAHEIAAREGDRVLEARQHASLTDALLHWVGVEPASFELNILRKLTLQAGDPFASIEFHLIGAEVAIKRRESGRISAHLETASGMLTRYANLVQLARLKILQATVVAISSSPFVGLSLANEAYELSLQSGSVATAIPALGNMAHFCLVIGRLDDCRANLAKVIPLIRRGGAVEIGVRDTELGMELAAGQEEKIDDLVLRLADLSSRLDEGHSYYGLWHALTRTRWLFRRGRPDEAAALALDAIPRIEEMSDRHLLERMRLLGAKGLALTGRAREGASLMATAVLANPDPPLEMIAEASHVAGQLAVADSLPAAVSHFERAARILSLVGNATARGQVVATAGEAFAEVSGGVDDDSSTLLAALYLMPRQTSIRLETAAPIAGDARALIARVVEGAGAAIDLAMHPSLLGHEVVRLIVDADAANVVALLETREGEDRDALVWAGCEVDRARALPEEPGVVRIPLGKGHGRTCEIVVVPPDAPSARATLLAIERLAHAALELHRSHEREREQSALWPEQTVEQQLGMVFASETMVELVNTTRRVATANVTVLITGETGTGKELFARALHQSSPRREQPFVPFNCTAVARDMIDAQLFGYRRGAFTGAHEAFPGVIRAAAGGTLFLDEIGEIGLEVQPKLLRFLESAEIQPLGEARPIDVDVRIVAATNANLERLVAEGRFREDLFYRLDVIRLNIPPLRERREEIPLLVEHFLLKYSQESKKSAIRVAEETMEYLVLYRWPGNARQLANEMHRLVALAESNAVLMPEHLSREIAMSRKTIPASERDLAPTELVVRIDQPLSAATEHLERAMIQHALTRTEGRVEDAARMLGLSRKGLYLKRQRFGLA